jgi:hypothetical protein
VSCAEADVTIPASTLAASIIENVDLRMVMLLFAPSDHDGRSRHMTASLAEQERPPLRPGGPSRKWPVRAKASD